MKLDSPTSSLVRVNPEPNPDSLEALKFDGRRRRCQKGKGQRRVSQPVSLSRAISHLIFITCSGYMAQRFSAPRPNSADSASFRQSEASIYAPSGPRALQICQQRCFSCSATAANGSSTRLLRTSRMRIFSIYFILPFCCLHGADITVHSHAGVE